MKSRSLIAGVLALVGLLACAAAAVAQPVYVPSSVERAAGIYVPITPNSLTFPDPVTGKATVVSSTNGLPVNCILGCGGGGGGGGGDASAANQVITNTRIGDVTSPGVGSTNYQLGQIYTRLNNPFQAGGSIGNTVFGATQSGAWNITNITGTVSLPTGAATSALQTTGNSSLGSIDTKLSSQATAANQTTGNSSLASILAKIIAAPATEAKQKGALTYALAAGSPFTLTSSWVKVVTTTAATKGLVVAPLAAAANFDIEWTSVTAGAAAPTDLYGVPVGYGDTFPDGLPIGDVYLKSATGMIATVRVGS